MCTISLRLNGSFCVLPGPTALAIQDLSNFAITVMIQKAVNLGHNLQFRL